MNLRLSHYGWMVTQHQANEGILRMGNSREGDLQIELFTGSHVPASDYPCHPELVSKGLVELIPDPIPEDETRLRYKRNPFEHITKVIFEFTTYCNFNCEHCYNGFVPRHTETDLHLLKDAAKTLLAMGVARFDFIGGEVSKYGNGWLELVHHIHSLKEKAQISLYTNGWWLDQQDFLAAGKTYADIWAYLADLKVHGVTHITFSLDGPGKLHDQSRHQPGLYERILKGLAQVKEAGLEARVSLLLRKEWDDDLFEYFLAEPATIIYDMDPDTPAGKRALRLHLDPFNAISNFIDIGNGAGDEQVRFPLLDAPNYPLCCRNFYRLSPSLTIKANGEIASCRLATAGEGYGNLHEKSMIEIVNHFDDAFISRLHIERRLDAYLPLVDREVFGDQFSHLCSLRAVITLLARKMDEQGVGMDDMQAIQRINHEVAKETGHLPQRKSSSPLQH